MHFPLLHRAFFNRFIVQSLPFPLNDPVSPGSSTVRAPFPTYAPPVQAYHASPLRHFCQTIFASRAILPAGCMGGLSLAVAFCGDDHPGVCASALDRHSRTCQRL
ncbi:hypothetical protein Tco_1426216 [Tanacetum coccineum]